ncbi:MAG: moderate conductance mechanosensitive channel [Gaiellaceae bacterium]|jgi:small conductance mechanosensitive channel|nr:moderate conductance mechanosensitive channel [Gaiellaceae bacterium]
MLTALTILLLFSAAWAVSRLSAIVARMVMAWSDRRHRSPSGDLRVKIIELKRRETSVAVIRTGIAYVAFAAALVLSAAQMTGGFDRLTTLAGASFVLILVGFSAQRVLVDIIAGFSMFTEKWYSVGDTIAIPTMELQGVVEDLSLRRTKLRSLDGEVISIHNSQIPAVRVLPGGVKEFDIELVASSREAAEVLIEHVASVLPEGPTTFIQRPTVHQIDELAPGLVRLRMRAAVAPGREWLVHGFYTDLLKERAEKHLIVHGPVVLTVDEGATRSFARASAATRWAGAP